MPETSQNDALNTSKHEARKHNLASINQEFNDFLGLHSADQKLLKRYHEALARDSETFAKVFYDYLMASPVTARVLKRYQAQGGVIDHLVKKQTQHLFGLLSGSIDDASARCIAHIGEIHHRYGIEPVWIMGAYRLYIKHLQACVRNGMEIKDSDRASLEDTITKLLFRDMGLMLEAYWDSGLLALLEEKEKVSDLQEQITSLLANIPQLLWSMDISRNQPLYVSPSSRLICEMDIDMPIPCMGWTVPEDREKVELAWQNALQGQAVEVESRVNLPNGKQGWFRRHFYPYRNKAGEVVRIDGLMEDTTEAKATLESLNTLATTDSLTGLTNRTLFHDRLSQAIASVGRGNDQQIVVMLMDLDRFKEINDTLGHPAGDNVLIQVAHRLQAMLRQTDTLARLGGDEFGILLPHIGDGHRTAERLAKKFLQAFVSPFNYDDNELYLGASIGIAIYPQHGEDVATLMSRADVAMYDIKNKEARFKFYHAELNPDAQQRLQLSGDLRRALERNELVLHYQPKIDLRSNTVVGAEALLRWNHPKHGLIPPDQFISLAERTGLIRPITDWVIETAIDHCQAWRQAGHTLRVAVNVSVRSFQTTGLMDTIDRVLQGLDKRADLLEIEITENVLMSDITHITAMLKRISDMGCRIAIDDFGTGYSSLAYLKKLPLHTLKIDKSFVLDMASDENDAAIVHSTIDLAHNLGLSIVAEGIENRETLDLLTDLGCDGGQGYYFSKPQPAETFLNCVK